MRAIFFVFFFNVLFILFSTMVLGDIFLSEIMFYPEDDIEWIEFYVNESFDRSNLKIKDNYQTDDVVCCDDFCEKTILENNYFLIFAKNKTYNVSKYDCINKSCFFYCVDDSLIGNGLGNNADNIMVFINNTLFVNFSYNLSIKKGITISLFSDTIKESFPSPWAENKIINSENQSSIHNSLDNNIMNNNIINNTKNISNNISENITNLSENLSHNLIEITNENIFDENISGLPDYEIIFNENNFFIKETYTNFFKVLNKKYPSFRERSNILLRYDISRNISDSGDILENDFLFYDEVNLSFISYTTKTSNFVFNVSGNFIICGELLVNDTNNENNKICNNIYVKNYKDILCNISFDIVLEKQVFELGETINFNFYVSNEKYPFEIEYWIENEFSDIVKNKQTTKNTNKKSFSPTKEGFYFINAFLYTSCNNTNNFYEDNIYGDYFRQNSFYVNKKYEKESKLEILNFSLKEGYIQTKLYVYKGNTSKRAIYLYFDNKKYTFYADENYKEYSFSFPIYYEDCGNKTLVLEGLDQEVRKDVLVECKEEFSKKDNKETSINSKNEISNELTNKVKNKQYSLIDFSKNITGDFYSIIRIYNNDNKTHSYNVSFYLYNGTKKYSNILSKEFVLKQYIEEEIFLENTLSKEVNGIIKMKIKILRDDRKTAYEFTENVFAFFQDENIKENINENMNEFIVNNFSNFSNEEFFKNETLLLNQENNEEPTEEKILLNSKNNVINDLNNKTKTNISNEITGKITSSKEAITLTKVLFNQKRNFYILMFVIVLIGIYFISRFFKIF